MDKLWVEKYRPGDSKNIILSEFTKNKIDSIIEQKDMPNIIITGNSGTGKTSTILTISKQLYGKYSKECTLDFNASDERGKKYVIETINNFCKSRISIPESEKNNYSTHKLILLDEADNMTTKAQQLISNLMDTFTSTRFAFTCNDSTKIIDAIQSRCTILRYKKLSEEQLLERLLHICGEENVKYTDEGIKSIVVISNGDMRQAINNLQLTHNAYGEVTIDNVFKLCDKPHPVIINDIFTSCYSKQFRKGIGMVLELHEKGYSSHDIGLSMIIALKYLKGTEIPEEVKIKYFNEISKTCIIISKGINSPLQLTGCISRLCLLS